MASTTSWLTAALAGAGLVLAVLNYRVLLRVEQRLVQSTTSSSSSQKPKESANNNNDQAVLAELAHIKRTVSALSSQSNSGEAQSSSNPAATNKKKNASVVLAWSAEDTVRWVEQTVGHNDYAALFASTKGGDLVELIEDSEHGFSFGDKVFFMGVSKEDSTALDRASRELV